MLGLLLPKTQDLLKNSVAPMPVLTRCMLALGNAAMRWGPVVVAAVLAAVVYVRFRLRRDAAWRRAVDMRLFSVPLLGRGYTMLAGCRFAGTMAVLIRGGVSLVDGLAHAGRATGSVWIAELAEKEAEAVRHGTNLSDAVARIPPLAETLPGYIRVGEASGGMERLLEGASERLRGQWDKFITRGLNLLEPALILLIGAFVLLVTLSVLLPILSFTRMVGR
jgi:general secretion pathway protein F